MEAVLGEKEGIHSWYCLNTKVRKEHVAAQHCEKICGIEAFAPRMKVRRLTRNEVWKDFIEPVFPTYFFARFSLASRRQILSLPGVTGIVHIGAYPGRVSSEVIESLKGGLSDLASPAPTPCFSEGQVLKVLSGLFKGQTGKVIDVSEATQRVSLLLELLGRDFKVDLHYNEVVEKSAF